MSEMRRLRQVLKVAKVIGRWPEVAGRQNNGADGEAGTSVKVMPYFKEDSGCARMFLVGCGSKETS